MKEVIENLKKFIDDINAGMYDSVKRFEESFQLEEGGLYRITLLNGKKYEAFYKHLNVSTYRNEIYVYLNCLKVKADGKPSKVSISFILSEIENIEKV